MDTLLDLLNQFNTYAKANPIIAGAFSLWGLGVITWLCRSLPMRLYGFIRRQFITTLTFTSSSQGNGRETFTNFMRWFERGRWSSWSRSLMILPTSSSYGGSCQAMSTSGPDKADPEEERGTVVGVGEGRHFFIYKGWPFWMSFGRITEGGNTQELIYQVHISTVGRNRQRVLELIEEFRFRPPPNRLGVFAFQHHGWNRLTDVAPRPLDTVVVNRALKGELVANLQRWIDSRSWYENRGLPYKQTYILKGLPGTGKTSLIKALASQFRMNLCVLNLATLSDSMLERALADAPAKSIIVIEDFDSAAATHARKGMVKPEQGNAGPGNEGDYSGLTLSGILNALDGIMSLDGKLIFLTTNVYETVDPALVRKGRIDFTYELTPLADTEVREYVELMFPGTEIPANTVFADILGCDLQDHYFAHRNDAEAFIDALPKHNTVVRMHERRQERA